MQSDPKKFQVGDAVYEGRKVEKYGKIISRKVVIEKWERRVGEWAEYEVVYVTWRRPYRGSFKDEECRAWHLSRFEDLIADQTKLVEKWTSLKDRAAEIV